MNDTLAVKPSLKILVVDDDGFVRDLLGAILAEHGHTVELAESGESGFARLQSEKDFDLIISDMNMPGMGGLELLQEVRRLDPHLPFIILTGNHEVRLAIDAMRNGANDYLLKDEDIEDTVVISVDKVMETHRLKLENVRLLEDLARKNQELERRSRFIQKTFGRYLSDDVVTRLLESPDGLTLGGEKKTVTILMADLRGFSMLSEGTAPDRVMANLNNYLGTMTRVINRYRGTIDEFIGDAVLALFGAPFTAADDATRAVACAIEMQQAMEEVNALALSDGLPPLEMGIALNTGEVLVGNIGSEERAKYGVVGSHVNLTGRIESFSVGGQILLSESTRLAGGEGLVTAGQTVVSAKGFRNPIKIYELRAIGAPYHLSVPPAGLSLRPLVSPIPVLYSFLTEKMVDGEAAAGELTAICLRGAEMRADRPLAAHVNLRIEIQDRDGEQLFAKVVEQADGAARVRFTAVPAPIVSYLRELMR